MTTARSLPCWSWRVSRRARSPARVTGAPSSWRDFVAVHGDRADLLGVHGLVAARAGGQGEVGVVFEQRGGDHEDDQQHETEVEHRGDVDLGEGLETLAFGEAAHGGLRVAMRLRRVAGCAEGWKRGGCGWQIR